MKAFKLLSNTALVFSLALLASCSSNDDIEPASNKVIEFTANLDKGTAADEATRATLESNNDVHWDLGDKLYVFCDNYEKPNLFSITPSSINGASAKFTSFEDELPGSFNPDEFYYALFPFGAATFDISTSKITSVLPPSQVVTKGYTYDKDGLIMIACADSYDRVFNFKNVPALLKVSVSNNGEGKVKYIEVVSKNSANRLSGNFRATVSYGSDELKLEAISDAAVKHTVKLEIPASAEKQDFLIAALPGVLNNGYTLKFEDAKGNVLRERTTKNGVSVELESSKIYKFGSCDVAKDIPTEE